MEETVPSSGEAVLGHSLDSHLGETDDVLDDHVRGSLGERNRVELGEGVSRGLDKLCN
jgi:hypothetical protein